MSDLTIACPNCGTTIPLDETLAGPLVAETRKTYEARLASVEATARDREARVKAEAEKLQAQREDMDAELTRRLAAERARIASGEAEKAKAAVAGEVAEMRRQAQERDAKLAEAQKAQADFVRQSRELADKQRELDLTIEKRVSEMTQALQMKARAEAEAQQALKLAERDKVISDLQRQMEEMQRRAEQGSQQLQGEVLELQLEALLARAFPHDRIEPVPKGITGADLLHVVLTPSGQQAGEIIWEMKRTKNWTDGWLAKLRADQRQAKAEIAVLLSEALPKGVESFALVEGIWVAHPRYAEPLALILRNSLIDISNTKAMQAGQETKMEMVYAYLTGPRFRHRVEAIVENFSAMRDDLNKERAAMQRLWAKREAQITQVIAATVGMHGDLQGIAGQAIGDIPMLDLSGSEAS
jgi:hypothetical protein